MKTTTRITRTVACLALLPFAATWAGDHKSEAPATLFWDDTAEVGTTQLVRTPNGLNAKFQTTGLAAGHTMTLWIMFFNNPDACDPQPCTLADAFNPDADFDFHYGGGHISNGNKTTISGHLPVNEQSTSGWLELGAPFVTELTNPMGADVLLAIHSHGPARTGTDLVDQITSYLGGCDVFLGPDGFASGPGDVPTEDGQCSTIQIAVHEAP